MSRTKTSGRLPPECDWRPFLIEPKGPLVWTDMFGNSRDVEVEIGSGKGLFLVTAATGQPARNFLGVEIGRKFAQFTAGRLARNSLQNARVARADARQVFAEWLQARSVAVVHVYFPDPWWKRRHKKRRIFSEILLDGIVRALVPGGELRIASDVEDYFQQMQDLIVDRASFELIASVGTDHPNTTDSLTNFERKYRKLGKPIWRSTFRLRAE